MILEAVRGQVEQLWSVCGAALVRNGRSSGDEGRDEGRGKGRELHIGCRLKYRCGMEKKQLDSRRTVVLYTTKGEKGDCTCSADTGKAELFASRISWI
jgi:hypothetical protein